jgi:hypothetical protein
MPGSWHLVKQLASGLRLEFIEDGAISPFKAFISSLRQSACTLSPLWHVICY